MEVMKARSKRFSPAYVAEAFLKEYYRTLKKCPEDLYKFYEEQSLLGWAWVDGDMIPVTTLFGIKEKIMSSDFKYCSVEVKTTDAQETLFGEIFLCVTGCFTGTDNMKNNYVQTFFLEKRDLGFIVLNDILRISAAASSQAEAENHQPTPSQNSAPSDTKNLGNGAAASTPSMSIPLGENKSVSPVKGAKAQSVDVKPATNVEIPSVENKSVSPAKDAKAQSVDDVKPDANDNVEIPSVVTPALNVAPKITYASVLATKAPKAASVTLNVSKQAVASPTAKPSSSSRRGDVTPKVSTPKGGVSKAATSSGKAIFIGKLPYDISEQRVVDVVKQFGPVRRHSNAVKIRRHPDGFCFGFVEFESTDSAENAMRAHHVMFGDKQAYITHKRQPPNNRR